MAHLPRGIDPQLLLSQVKGTMPYLAEDLALAGHFPPARVLADYAQADPSAPLSHFEYFRLCVSSHYLTCATPVPTDVDNQIRHKLWPAELPLDTALEMARLVLESRRWDFNQVTARFVCGAEGTPWAQEPLSGHLGEWFTVAAGAYCGLRRQAERGNASARAMRAELFAAILDEIQRHSEIFGSLWKAQDGIACLKAAAAIAHNFGDLDRVMDMWSLGPEDALRRDYYRLAVEPLDSNRKLRYLGRLWAAGQLYKSQIHGSAMALENHRHFALRKPRCLRRRRDILIPTGPFFDDWGLRIAKYLATPDGKPSEDTLEVALALRRGWEKMPKTMGYGRALRGMLSVHENLDLGELTRDRPFRAVLETSQAGFERQWNEVALRELDEIPSRA